MYIHIFTFERLTPTGIFKKPEYIQLVTNNTD